MMLSQRGFFNIIILVIIALVVLGVGVFVLGKGNLLKKVQPQITQDREVDLGSGVKATGSKYKTVQTKPTGWFTTGQDADIMLSGIDFNNAGGPLLFNHPGGIASHGTHFLLADRNNNRVLIWNKLPTGNTAPDLVLGQPDFTGNNAGTKLNELNWPVAVATADGKVVVADTNNDRILIWSNFPTRNGQPADIEIKRGVGWPWAVWTNGEKLVVTSTAGSRVLIWNSFPKLNQEADIVLTANGNFGTPRSIASDGKHLMIGDHNAKLGQGRRGNFFWNTFPTQNDQKYDFFVGDVFRMGEERRPDNAPMGGDVLWGGMSSDGKLIGVTNMLYIWSSFPENEQDAADLKVGGTPGNQGYDFGGSQSGDGTNIVVASGKVYISLSNGNKIVGFNSMPTRSDQEPDFAIGAPNIYTNTLETNYFLTSPTPVTDGKSLFVSAEFGRKLYVWKNLPDESGAHPDFVYSLPDGPFDNALLGNTLVLAGHRSVYVWKSLPLNGQKPDITLEKSIGNVTLQVQGVALDEKYFYLADPNAIYVWEGIPSKDANPKFTIAADKPGRLSSNGRYLTATAGERGGAVLIYDIPTLSSTSQPHAILGRLFNGPQSARIFGSHLFVADTGFHRVLIWDNIEDAIAGKSADISLGHPSVAPLSGIDPKPAIGRNTLFNPAVTAFDGSYLWVGEMKFSGRLLRFPVH